jgi:hypothetical protein
MRTRRARRFRTTIAPRSILLGSLAILLAAELVTPLATAMAPTSAVALPTSGLNHQVFRSTEVFGCGVAKDIGSPTWSAKNDMFQGSVQASSSSCRTGSSDAALASEEINLETKKLHFSSSSYHHLTVEWTFNVSELWGVTPYSGCVWMRHGYAYCEVQAGITISIQTSLTDVTNTSWGANGNGEIGSTFVPIDNSTLVQNSSVWGNGSSRPTSGYFAGSIHAHALINLAGRSHLSTADTYRLSIQVSIGTWVQVLVANATMVGTASAHASLGMSGSGLGATIERITLS